MYSSDKPKQCLSIIMGHTSLKLLKATFDIMPTYLQNNELTSNTW